jgi:hypothetical protein
VVGFVGLALWGAVDAATLPTADWTAAGRSRTRWVALQGILAPFGLGAIAAAAYAAVVRPAITATSRSGIQEPIVAREGSLPV